MYETTGLTTRFMSEFERGKEHASISRALRALESLGLDLVVLPRGQAGAMLRAFGFDPRHEDPWGRLPAQGARLSPLAAATLRHGVRRFVEEAGLRIDHCGCPAQCHLDPELTPGFVPLLTSDLFEHTA